MAVGELVVSIIGDMRELSRTFTQVQGEIDGVAKKFDKMGKSLSSAGSSLTAGVTAPILGFVAAGAGVVKWGSDVIQSQGKVQVSLGLTAEEADKLTDSAMNVWKNGFGDSIDSVNQVIVTVRQNMGDLAGQELESVATGAITISDIFGDDVNEVTAAAGVLMKNFGIDGQHALDLITAGYQQGGDFSKELLDTLREYAPQFQTMGINADEFLAILISGAQAGAWNLDKVGDAVKEFNIRAQDGSALTMEGFAAIGLNADEMAQKIAAGGDTAKEAFMATVAGLMAMEDPVERNIAGVALFGTQWEDVKAQVIDATASGIKNVQDVTGATEKAAKDVADSNPFKELTRAGRELQADLLPVIEKDLIPLVKDVLIPLFRDDLVPILQDYVIPLISTIAAGFGALPKPVKVAVLAIMALLAALGPILVVIGSVVSAVGALAAAFGTGGALAGALVSAKAAAAGIIAAISSIGAPILILIGVVALLAAAWSQNWGDIQGKTKAVWEWLKTAARNLYNDLRTAYTNISNSVTTLRQQFNTAWDSIKSLYESVKNSLISTATGLYKGLQGVYNSIVSAVTSLLNTWRTNWDNFKATTTAAASALNSILVTLYNYVLTQFNNVRTAALNILNNWRTHWSTFQAATTAAANHINSALSTLYNYVRSRFDSIVKAILNLLSDWRRTWDNIVNAAKDAGNRLVTAIKGLPGDIKALASNFATAGKALMDALYDSIIGGFDKAIKKAKEKLAELRKLLPSSPAEEGPFKRLPNWDSAISEPLNKSVSNATSSAKSAGASIVNSISNGIKSAGTKVYRSAKKVFNSVKKLLPHSPADEGPFSEIPNWDSIFMEPMLESIEKTRTLAEPLKKALGSVRSPIDSLSSGFNKISTVSNVNNIAGDTITIGPNTLSNGVDVRMLIEELNRYTANKRRAKGLFI